MIIIEPLGGLANRMRLIASALCLQREFKCKVVCVWVENADLNAPFDLLFEDISGLKIVPKARKYNFLKSSNQSTWYKKFLVNSINLFSGVNYCLKQCDFEQLIMTKKVSIEDIIKKNKNVYIQIYEEFGDNYNEFQYFKPIKPLLDKINSIGKSFDESTIGLHIRRADHLVATEYSPLELFVDKMDKEIILNNEVSFYLSTDDKDVETELTAKFKNRILTHQKEFSRNTGAGMQDAVIDMFCLSKTTKIYGSYWSSFSDIAARIGRIESETLKKSDK